MRSPSTILKLLVLVAVVAITIVAGASALRSLQKRQPSPTPSATTIADATPTPTATVATPTPTPRPTATPVPPSPVPPGPAASIRFTQLGVAVGGPSVTVTFVSDGEGLVTALLETATAPVAVCLRPGTDAPSCRTWTTGNLSVPSSGVHESWNLTLAAVGTAPVVTLALTYPSAAPAVRLTGARFGGTAYAGFDGLDLRFVPRSSGSASFSAGWGIVYRYEFGVHDTTRGTTLLSFLGTDVGVSQTFVVTPPDTWRVAVINHSRVLPDALLSAAFSWP